MTETPEIIDPIDSSSYSHIPTGKPIDPPTTEKIIPSYVYPIDKIAVSNLFDRHERPAPSGESNRKTLTFTISLQTDEEWRDFLKTYTGTQLRRGVGISSPMVELSMRVLMGMIADFKLSEVAIALKEISATPLSQENLKNNLISLTNQI